MRPLVVVTCAQCREEVLDADGIGDEEECPLRDHLSVATALRWARAKLHYRAKLHHLVLTGVRVRL